MSVQDVRKMVSMLPRSLADQIVGYVESVQRSLPDIFRDAGRQQTSRLEEQVIFIAALKKIHWLAASSFWTLENAGSLLATMDVDRIRIGGTDVSRSSEAFLLLQSLLADLEKTFDREGVYDYIKLPWPELVRELAPDGRQ